MYRYVHYICVMNKRQTKYLKSRGEILRKWRISKNISQTRLAVESGMSRKTISLMENGKSEYTVLSLENYIHTIKRLTTCQDKK